VVSLSPFPRFHKDCGGKANVVHRKKRQEEPADKISSLEGLEKKKKTLCSLTFENEH